MKGNKIKNKLFEIRRIQISNSEFNQNANADQSGIKSRFGAVSFRNQSIPTPY